MQARESSERDKEIMGRRIEREQEAVRLLLRHLELLDIPKEENSSFIVGRIEGGNHAQFGNYGEQKSDHAAKISREEQQAQTAEAILNMMEAHKEQKQEKVIITYEQISPQEAKERMDKEADVVSVYMTPEELWGYVLVTSAYKEMSEVSRERIYRHVQEHYPDAKEKIRTLIK